jgi:hypothetical protein
MEPTPTFVTSTPVKEPVYRQSYAEFKFVTRVEGATADDDDLEAYHKKK